MAKVSRPVFVALPTETRDALDSVIHELYPGMTTSDFVRALLYPIAERRLRPVIKDGRATSFAKRKDREPISLPDNPRPGGNQRRQSETETLCETRNNPMPENTLLFLVQIQHCMDDIPVRLFTDEDAAEEFAKNLKPESQDVIRAAKALKTEATSPLLISIILFVDGLPCGRRIVKDLCDVEFMAVAEPRDGSGGQ